MKKKVLITLIFVVMLLISLAISISAATYSPAFGKMTEVEGMAEKSTFGNDGKFDTCTSRVLMNDGITYPSYYIYTDSATHTVNFSELNKATGKSYDRNTVICLEIPEGVTTIPNCFAASGSAIFWGDKYTSTLEYLKFSSTVSSMSTDATIYSMKSLKCVDMSLSQIQEIPSRGFQSASALNEIYFPATLKTVGQTSFMYCSSLTHLDFTSTALEDVQLRAFFECKKLEEVKLGDNIKKIQTQCFYKAGVDSDKTTVNFYIGNTFEEIKNEYGQILQDAKNAVVYYTGSNEDTGFSVLHSNALKNGAANWATVDAGAKDFDKNATYTANTIIYNYNLCDAFYDGKHAASQTTYGFAGEKYTTPYCSFSGCSRAGCNNVVTVQIAGALFENKGYSKVEDGTSFTYGIIINEKNIADYKAKTGEEITYGFIVGAVPNEPTGDIISAEGESLLEKTVVADFTTLAVKNLTIYNVKMVGIDTDVQKAQLIYCCAYVIDANTVSYIGEKVTDKAVSVSSNSILVIETTTPPITDKKS